MLELAIMVAGIQMVEKMQEVKTMERLHVARTVGEAEAIVQETERFAFEIADDIFKDEAEIGAEGIEAKEEFIKMMISHNYDFFELDNPLENGVTFEEIKFRSGYSPMGGRYLFN